jgi:hypothetical protein
MFLPPSSDFRYRSKFLACKQGKRSLQHFVHDLRFLAANVNDEESLPEALRATVFMDGLNHGLARTQLFREYPATFEAAVRIALTETFSSSFARGRADSSDKEVTMVAQSPDDRPRPQRKLSGSPGRISQGNSRPPHRSCPSATGNGRSQ